MKEQIRTIGLYQPFGSLMLPDYNKLETRWTREGHTAPFPLGKYLIYTTKTPADIPAMVEWCGIGLAAGINELMATEKTIHYNGYALGLAELIERRDLKEEDQNTYIRFVGRKTEIIKGKEVVKTQRALKFVNVQRIEPFKWNYGKQGVGFVPESELSKIKILE